MNWIAPTEKDTATAALKKRLKDAADRLRANSGLKSQEYSGPVAAGGPNMFYTVSRPLPRAEEWGWRRKRNFTRMQLFTIW